MKDKWIKQNAELAQMLIKRLATVIVINKN
jgi:hypothetical protein